MSEGLKYPLATGDAVHFSPPSGSVLVWMTPSGFLALCPSLQITDEEEDDYIMALRDHIVDQMPLDAPELSLEHHDGRHRATAARIAGVESLPIFMQERLAQAIGLIDE